MGGAVQRKLLESEGVVFTAAGVIPLREYQWQPTIDPLES